ncbi:ornithine cyclodeaminase family protein [Lutibaculum baratangense]|uniref:Ornithine cyclodeaminase n=1 Tax=Lutibaculum baratangense AMV1 TaxID=631454 RepID=V4RJQ9_9HYPH|nr:ornithine cyclodeaminase [Lutibaculum baratangense]ESR25559.1 Ornithine cyclodeaminase [Lutibaculum baratangense AMV1]
MMLIDAKTVDEVLDWKSVVEALREGHRGARPQIDDLLMREGQEALLVRAAWQGGVGIGLKAVSVFPRNPESTPPLPAVQGQFLLFDGRTGEVAAVIDGAAITRWKTAGDSALGSALLSREDARALTMVGAGAQAEPLIRAHLAVRPSIGHVRIWNRSAPRAEALAARLGDAGRQVEVAGDLAAAVGAADIVCVATMATEPIVKGAWLKPGTHLDLVGAYRPDMREADDEALRKGRLYVDARETTVHEIGELMIPLASGAIREDDVIADFFDLVGGAEGRRSDEEITVFKNGGGAHLDLMTAQAIHRAAQARV